MKAEETNKKQKEKKPNKLTKKGLVAIIASAIVCLGIGGVGGYFIGQGFFANLSAIDYSQYSADELEDNNENLMKRYSRENPSNYLHKFKPYELAEIALNKIANHENVRSVQYGNVHVPLFGVEQTIRTQAIKNGEKYYLENISASSMVKAAKRFYQEGDEVKSYDGGSVSLNSAIWNKDPTSVLSKKEHAEVWGKDLTRPSIYIVSKATALDTSTAVRDGDGYKVSLELDPILSVLRYVKQMTSISNVQSPKFHSVHIEYKLSNDLTLLETKIEESYSVVMVTKAESTAVINEYYFYDSGASIPCLDTNAVYEGDN